MNQKGFAPAIVLLVALGIVALGVGGYFIINKLNPVTQPPQTEDEKSTSVTAPNNSSSSFLIAKLLIAPYEDISTYREYSDLARAIRNPQDRIIWHPQDPKLFLVSHEYAEDIVVYKIQPNGAIVEEKRFSAFEYSPLHWSHDGNLLLAYRATQTWPKEIVSINISTGFEQALSEPMTVSFRGAYETSPCIAEYRYLKSLGHGKEIMQVVSGITLNGCESSSNTKLVYTYQDETHAHHVIESVDQSSSTRFIVTQEKPFSVRIAPSGDMYWKNNVFVDANGAKLSEFSEDKFAWNRWSSPESYDGDFSWSPNQNIIAYSRLDDMKCKDMRDQKCSRSIYMFDPKAGVERKIKIPELASDTPSVIYKVSLSANSKYISFVVGGSFHVASLSQ